MKRQIYTAEHETFRELARTFLAKEVVPNHEKWEAAGVLTPGARRRAVPRLPPQARVKR